MPQRVVDSELGAAIWLSPAVSLFGPRGCGKTTSTLRHARSAVLFNDVGVLVRESSAAAHADCCLSRWPALRRQCRPACRASLVGESPRATIEGPPARSVLHTGQCSIDERPARCDTHCDARGRETRGTETRGTEKGRRRNGWTRKRFAERWCLADADPNDSEANVALAERPPPASSSSKPRRR